MIRTRTAGTRTLLIGLAVAAVMAAGAAAAMPVLVFRLHAHLAPAAASRAAGQFNGLLVRTGGAPVRQGTPVVPRVGVHWRLTWKVTIPASSGPATVSLRVGAARGARAAVRVLTAHSTTRMQGAVTLTGSQALRIAKSDAVVIVRTRTATWRGAVKVSYRVGPLPQ